MGDIYSLVRDKPRQINGIAICPGKSPVSRIAKNRMADRLKFFCSRLVPSAGKCCANSLSGNFLAPVLQLCQKPHTYLGECPTRRIGHAFEWKIDLLVIVIELD